MWTTQKALFAFGELEATFFLLHTKKHSLSTRIFLYFHCCVCSLPPLHLPYLARVAEVRVVWIDIQVPSFSLLSPIVKG